MNHESGAVVIGGHYQGLGVVRSLARKGVRVVVIDSEPCLFSPCDQVHTMPGCS